VVDIKEDHTHDSIGDRAFARDPDGVALRAGAFLDGLQQSGIQGCLKHFPGLGRSQRDTHFSGEVIHGDLGTLLTHDMLPYQTLLRKAPMVMLAHAIYPAVSLTEASCSATFVDLLRSFYEFEGLILSDDMTMGAIASHTCVASMIDALSAGVDFVLICKDLDLWAQAIEAIDTQMKKSPWFHKRVEHAAQRMALFQKHLPPSWPWP
jgi:beta-N-acetylhexosaminidase